MTRSPAKNLTLALLLALAAAAPAVRAQTAALDAERRVLVVERDPDAAERFLNDAGLQAALRAQDEAAYLSLFRAAAELRDLRQLLRGYQQEKRVLRDGLAARPDCSFCQDPAQLVAWSERWKAAPRDLLRESVFEWDTLAAPRRTWLAGQGVAEAAWRTMKFSDRLAKLRVWAKAEQQALLKMVPRAQGELDAMSTRVEAVDEFLDHDGAIAVDERYDQAATAVKRLADAEKRLAGSRDAKLLEALQAARGAADLEGVLSNLGRVFDGLGVHDADLRTAAPMKPGAAFDAPTAKLAAEMLGPALLREVAGTRAGDALASFYAKTPMKITVEREKTGTMATYYQGVLNFDRGNIEDFLKARGRAARDLVCDHALMAEFVRELAPVFVHEATHHRQDVWATENKINGPWSQYQEIEAMETEATYVLQKAAQDPSYKAYLAKSGKNSPNAREALSLARRMETEGADQFRRSIRAWHYPGLLSLEGSVWERSARHGVVEADIRAELARRAALPPTRRLLLEGGPTLDTDFDTRDEFLTALRHAGTQHLREALAAEEKENAALPSVYARHRARADAADREAEALLADLKAGKLASLPKTVVPSPGAPR